MGFGNFKLKEEEFIISGEAAEDQMAVFLQHYRISNENITDSVLIKGCELAYDKLTTAIRKGSLIIETDSESRLVITHTLANSTGEKVNQIKYAELSGKHKVQDEKFGDDPSLPAISTQRTYSVMANLANLGMSDIMKFKGMDLTIVESLGFFLLNV